MDQGSARILIVDDEEPIREVISSLLETQGYVCEMAPNGTRAAAALDADPLRYDLVLSDIVMPEMNGLTLLKHIRARHPDMAVMMLSAVHDLKVALDAIRQGAYDYIVKPFEKEQLFFSVSRALERRRLIAENRRYQLQLEELVKERTQQLEDALSQLERSYDITLEALGSALDLKDSGTEGHSRRVTAYSIAIARQMNVSPAVVKTIARGAYLHDIGKIGIPDAILNKPGSLTDYEREIMKTHCERGWQILNRIPFLGEAAEIVLAHQEHYDGTGYPRQLSGDGIHVGARIFAVADAIDAMISDRPYRRALAVDQALEEIARMAGSQFDPAVVQAALDLPRDLWGRLHGTVGKTFGAAAAYVHEA